MTRPIAYLTSSYARAGDTFIRREVEELRRRGWTVHTFSIRRPDEGEQVSEEIAREQATTDYILERGTARLLGSLLRVSLRHPRRVARALRQVMSIRWPGVRSCIWHAAYLLEAAYLAEQLEVRDVALLHDHIAMNSGTVALLASTLAGVPFGMTVHGLELLEADRWALGRKIEASALTVCVSSFGKAQCMMFTAPGQWGRLHEIRCGLDLDSPAPVRTPPPDVARLVCVGRLSPEKGQLVLVQAAARLRRAGLDVEIVLVGDGPSREEILHEAWALHVEDRIRLTGWQGSADVLRWISESRALVVPSFTEGIPVVLMEAMALERPVIASCVGGIPELVRPGENGWLVPAGSAEDLAEAIREVLATPPETLHRMGEKGRNRVQERHDLRMEVGKLAGLFDRVLEMGDDAVGGGR